MSELFFGNRVLNISRNMPLAHQIIFLILQKEKPEYILISSFKIYKETHMIFKIYV